MRKLGAQDENEKKIENYKKEQLRQQEIREEKIRMERIKQERIREEQIRKEKLLQEKIRQERIRKEEALRKEKLQKEQMRQNELRKIKIREEKIRQEKIRQEKIRQEKLKQQEKIKKQEIIKQEKIKQLEKPKVNTTQKTQKVESYKKIVIDTTASSKARSDSVKKQFKAHSGRYIYKDNINEEISHYRNDSNYKEQKNVARKETIYKNTKKKEMNKSYNKLPIKININTTTSYSRNHSSKNLKSETEHSVKIKDTKNINKNQSYQIKTTKTTVTNNISKNSFKPKNTTSNYTKQSYKSNTSYSNLSKNTNLPNKNNNYKRSMLKVEEKTTSLNYPNPNIKVDTYGPNYKGEAYHRDYVNIENVNKGKIMNHIHTGLSKDGQYLINMTSAQKIYDENEALYAQPEKDIEEIISTVKEKKKNLGDNYAFYESKHLQKPDNSSYTIHKRFGERTIFGKEKYETRKVRHYKVKSGEEGKYYDLNDNGNNYYENNNMVEYRDCGYGCLDGNNQNIEIGEDYENYENVNYDYSPDSPERIDGQEAEYENRVEEYNYESY